MLAIHSRPFNGNAIHRWKCASCNGVLVKARISTWHARDRRSWFRHSRIPSQTIPSAIHSAARATIRSEKSEAKSLDLFSQVCFNFAHRITFCKIIYKNSRFLRQEFSHDLKTKFSNFSVWGFHSDNQELDFSSDIQIWKVLEEMAQWFWRIYRIFKVNIVKWTNLQMFSHSPMYFAKTIQILSRVKII